MSLRRWSMSVKLFLAASVLAVSVIAALAASLLRRERAQLVDAAANRAQSYASACREALFPQEDAFALHFATQQAGKFPGVSEAAAFDASGRILSHTDSRRIGDVEPAAAGLERADAPRLLPYGAGGVDIVVDLRAGRRLLGWVRLRLTDRSLSAALAQTRRFVLTLAAVAAGLNGVGAALLLARERKRLRSQLGRYVSTEVAASVLEGMHVEGRRCEVTVLFTDLRGFTSLSEHLPPEEVVGLLNDYFEQMVQIIDAHGGWVDKFIGDGLLAVFAPMRERPDHAARASACALELRECLARLNVGRRQRGLAALKLGVAVNTGAVVAGTVGAKARLDYTVIGDTVNVASRLEGLNARLGTDLLVTQSTYERTRELFAHEPLGEVSVRGHESPVCAYRLLGRPRPAAAPAAVAA